MLKTACIHPEILGLTASCGHGDKILIADAHYPADSAVNPEAPRIFLNLTRGIPKVTEVLEVMAGIMAIEKAEVMIPDTGKEPEIYDEFRSILGQAQELCTLGRFDFYEAGSKENVKMVIITGEYRTYANILLTMGLA